MFSDEPSALSDELVPGGVADALAAQLEALASVRTSGDLGDAMDMLDVEASTGIDDSSLDDFARSARVHEHDMASALDS